MRKIPLILLSALAGAGATALVSQSHLLTSTSAVAASAETYRQLSLFGDVFEKVRSDYVEKPEEAKLIESVIPIDVRIILAFRSSLSPFMRKA